MINLPLKNKPRQSSLLIALLVLILLTPFWWQSGIWYRERILTDTHKRIEGLLNVYADFLSTAIHQRLGLLRGLSAFADAHIVSGMDIDPKEFTAFAGILTNGTAGIRSIVIAPGGIALFIYPAEDNENIAGQDLISDRRASVRTDVRRAMGSRRLVLSGPYAIRQKGLELVARQAVYSGDTFWGIVAVTFDLSPVFTEALLDPQTAGLELVLQDSTGHRLYGKGNVLKGSPVLSKVDLPDRSWKLAAAPAEGWNSAVEKSLLQFRGITLAILFLLTSLIYLLTSYRLRLTSAVRQRTGELQRSLMNHRQEGEQLNHTLGSMRKAMRATLEVLVLAVETKDPYTSGHQRRVADLARTIATEMGHTGKTLDGIRMAALLHDIGKISLPAEILSKPTRLMEVELNLINTHSQAGYGILKEIDFPWPIARIVWQHHERLDGSGYPLGLVGEEILPEARILAVADVVEAMGAERSYRPMPGLEKALEEIRTQRGVLYDPVVVDACICIFTEKEFRLS